MAVISDVSSEHVSHEVNKNITLEVIKFDFCCQLDQIALFFFLFCVLYSEQPCMIYIYNIYAPLGASNWLCNIAIFGFRVLVEKSSYSLIFCLYFPEIYFLNSMAIFLLPVCRYLLASHVVPWYLY